MAALVNVDCTDEMTVFKQAEIDLCGESLKVDVVARMDDLPFEGSSLGFIVNSHSFEHCANPIRCLLEWHHVLRHGGIIYTHIPQRDAHPGDRGRPISSFQELRDSFNNDWNEETHPIRNGCECKGGHYFVWDIPLYLAMVNGINGMSLGNDPPLFEIVDVRERDDKCGNSLVFVLQVVK